MASNAKKRLNPLEDVDYEDEPYEVVEKFAIYVPKPRNELLEILRKHIEKQIPLQQKPAQTKEASQILRDSKKESGSSEEKGVVNYTSKLREKLNGMLSDTHNLTVEEANPPAKRKNLNRSGAESQNNSQNLDKSLTFVLNETQNQIPNVRSNEEPKGRSLSPSPDLRPANAIRIVEFNTESKGKDISPEKKRPENRLEPQITVHVEHNTEKGSAFEEKTNQVEQNGKIPDQQIKEKRKNQGPTKEMLFSWEKPVDSPLKLPDIKPTKPSEEARASHQNNQARYALRSTLSSFETPVPKQSTMAKIARFSRSSDKKPRGLSLDQALGENIIPVEQGPKGTFYGTLRTVTPQTVKNATQKSWHVSPDQTSKTSTPNSNSLAKQMQYDFETKSYVGSLLKVKLAEDLKKYEDLIMRNQPLLTGLVKLRDSRLLKQNPVLVRKYQPVERFNFIDSGAHTKNSSVGYSRNVFGGFYAK